MWSSDSPNEVGYYWFYGDPCNRNFSDDDTPPLVDADIFLVELTYINNEIVAITKGRFVSLTKFDKYNRCGYIGYWRKADVPIDTENLFSSSTKFTFNAGKRKRW